MLGMTRVRACAWLPTVSTSGWASGVRGLAAITPDNVNPNMVRLEYALHGPLVTRAAHIENELQNGAKKPFTKVIKANIGDAHAMGQKPITFVRQVLACVSHPALIEQFLFPEDVKQRAKDILQYCGGGSAGSYTQDVGIELIRRHVADYISNRDEGIPSDWKNVCLCLGATRGIKNVLQLLCNSIGGKPSGVMLPIPQHPLYSATLAEYGLSSAPYYLEEERGWAIDEQELERAIAEAASCAVRAIVVINPGNPTGQVQTRDNIELVIKFARNHNLLILADEVYQDNVYDPCSKFHSFKKVMMEMGEPYSSKQELVSFNSVSKGFIGECGIRGGWMEIVNLELTVQAHLYKTISAMLCPTSLGQVAVDCRAKPPVCADPSYELFNKERTQILSSLAENATMIADTFNNIQGFKCNTVQGAMYAFPQFQLSKKVIEAADKANLAPDVYYAFELLEQTGICIVPGSVFGQKPGSYHFRTTILPQTPQLKEMLNIFKNFHEKFTKEHA